MKDRAWTQRLDRQTRIVTARSSAYPITYAITLVTKHADCEWAVRTYDNAHAINEHHAHRYIGDQKQPPSVIVASVNEAMAQAMADLLANWPSYIEEWKRTLRQ